MQFCYLPTVHACMPLYPLYPGQATCKHSPGGLARVRRSSGRQVKRQCVHSRDAHPLGRILPSLYCPWLLFNIVSSTALHTPWLPSSLSLTLPGVKSFGFHRTPGRNLLPAITRLTSPSCHVILSTREVKALIS